MIHQCESVPCHYVLDQSAGDSEQSPSLKLRSTESAGASSFGFSFEAIRNNVFRTTFSSSDHPTPPYPSAPRPDPIPLHPGPERTTNLDGKIVTLQLADAKATVEWSHTPVISLFLNGVQKPQYQDLPFRSYAVDGDGIAHYSTYEPGSLYVGLGEKAAPMNLAGRGFIISASDTFGYDAYRTDPLYKHIPLLIHITPQGCVGIFSTSHARGTWSIGSEIDGLWGHFKVYRQAYGGLEQFLIVGRTVADVVRSYADLVGYPLLVPRYMMGYIGGGMKYSMGDDPRACDAILSFIKSCEEHDIPVSAFQMSSGYTVAETEPKTRNVFTWNRHRFADPKAFAEACHRYGVRLLANVKPYVLANHPAYQKLVEGNAFFTDPATKDHGVARLWSAGGGESGEGGHLDLTSKAGFQWWYDGCRALKDVGIDGIWNDNNEFNIASDKWECALDVVPVPDDVQSKQLGLWGRAIHTELMGKSSYEACVDAAPDERPLVLTRSATAGTMRYACCSWSGDNTTSWESMRGGNALALNAGFSLLQCYGHDTGGFEGPQPTPELLLRWIQLGIHTPRFVINCYKTSPEDNLVGDVIEPWMYPALTPLVRAAIKRRYELIPYTYSLALRAHRTAVPPQRWTGWGYEEDAGVWAREVVAGDAQFWFGDSLLVAGVYEEGKADGRVYLPRKGEGDDDWGYLNTNAPFEFLEGGRWHSVSATWHASIPVIARCGGAVPVGKNRPTRCKEVGEEYVFGGEEVDDWRGVEIFPPPVGVSGKQQRRQEQSIGKIFVNSWLEDDGISCEAKAEVVEVEIQYGVQEAGGPISVKVAVSKEGTWEPLWLPNGVDIILPVGEERAVVSSDGRDVVYKGRDVKGRRVWKI